MVRGCPVLVALRAWRPASRPTLPNSRAIGCRCAMKSEQAGENAKGIVRLCGAHPVRRPIHLVYYDRQTNDDTVPVSYAKLIDVDKVDLLMGHATNLIVAAMPLIIERKKLVMVLFTLASNAEFKYPPYFQSTAFAPDSK